MTIAAHDMLIPRDCPIYIYIAIIPMVPTLLKFEANSDGLILEVLKLYVATYHDRLVTSKAMHLRSL